MAETIDVYGIEETQVRAEGHAPLKPNELQGRVRIARFSYTCPVGDLAENAIIALCRLPKGARIMGGVIKGEAMGGSATVDVGLIGADGNGYYNDTDSTADDIDALLDGGSNAGAHNLTFADTIARNYGIELDKECYVAAKAVADNFDAGQDMVGHVEYVVD